MTHADLVRIASRWLQSRCPVVITEMASAWFETPDAIGFTAWKSILVECKTSRADFIADGKKVFRNPNYANAMGNHRYYMAPKGLLKPEEMPEKWGLLEVSDIGKVREVVKAQLIPEYGMMAERSLLLSCLRRVAQNAPQGISVKCYTHQTKCKASVSVEPESEEDD